MTIDYPKLIKQAQEGNQDAIAELYKNTYNLQHYLVKQLIKNEEDANDILQNAYVKAFTHLDKLQKPEKFPSWLGRITTNTAKDYLKRKKMVLFSELTEEDNDNPIDFEDEHITVQPEQSLDAKETKRIVQEIIDTLPDDQRWVTILYYLENMGVKEISTVLECPENTVKSRLNYARKKIKEQVLKLEKGGTKLYGLAPLPFFVWLLRQDMQSSGIPHAASKIPPAAVEQLVQQAAPQVAAAGGAIGMAGVAAEGVAGLAAAGSAAATAKTAGALAVLGVLKGKAVLSAVSGLTAVVVGGSLIANALDTSAVPYSESYSMPAVSVSQPTPPLPVKPVAPPVDQEEDPNLWRQAYYDVAVLNLNDGAERFASNLYLYYPLEGPPIMAMGYADRSVYEEYNSFYLQHTKMWRMKEGQAILIYDGPQTNMQINTDTGNPIVNKTEDRKRSIYEIHDGTEIPLYEYRYEESQYYTYRDDKLWSEKEFITKQPLKQYPLIGYSDELSLQSLYFELDDAQKKLRLYDFFAGTYEPSVPSEAPEWVSSYMKYIHNHLMLPYRPDQKIPENAFTQLTIYEPLKAGGEPILKCNNLVTEDFGEAWLFISDGQIKVQYGINAIQKDTQGKYVMQKGYEDGYGDWYSLTSSGQKWLFSSGASWIDGNYYVYMAEKSKQIEEYEQLQPWLINQLPSTLGKFGYVGNMKPLANNEYFLPENATWAELEPALIDILCRHAKTMGQWGT